MDKEIECWHVSLSASTLLLYWAQCPLPGINLI